MEFKVLLYLYLFIFITQINQARSRGHGRGGGRGRGSSGHGSGGHSSGGHSSGGHSSGGHSSSSGSGSNGGSYGGSSHGSSYGSSSYGSSSGSGSYGSHGSSSGGGSHDSISYGSHGSRSYGSSSGSGGKSGSSTGDRSGGTAWGGSDSMGTSGSKHSWGDFDIPSPPNYGTRGTGSSSGGTKNPWEDFELPSYGTRGTGSSSGGTKYPWGDFELPSYGTRGTGSSSGGTKYPWGDFELQSYGTRGTGSSSGGTKNPWEDFELPSYGTRGTGSSSGGTKYPWGDFELQSYGSSSGGSGRTGHSGSMKDFDIPSLPNSFGNRGTGSTSGKTKYPWGDFDFPSYDSGSSGGSKTHLGDFEHSVTKWGNKESGTSNNHPPTTHKTEYKPQPSAPKLEDHKKTESAQQSLDKPSSDTPSAPSVGGSYGGYRHHYHHSHSNGHGSGNSTTTEKPYAPASIFQPTRFNAPYPTGNPQGAHPMPQTTGILGHSSYPQSGSFPYPTGTHQYPGSYGTQGNPSYPQSVPYPQQAGYPMNSGGYHPSYPSGGSSFSQPEVVYVPTAVSSSRSTGDIFKEALIHSTVNAGVNAAANRLFYPSHFSGPNYAHANGGNGDGYNHTEVTHNNYYYNQPLSGSQGGENSTSSTIGSSTGRLDNSGSGTISVNHQGTSNQASGNVASGVTANNVNPSNIPPVKQPQLVISDEELRNLTEDLFSRQEFDASQYIKLNLQKKINSTNVTDESTEPLLEVQPEVNTILTIELIQTLYDNYEFNSQIKEKASPEKAKKENDLLEVILQTNVMSKLMSWLAEKKYITPDMLSKKEILTRIWFAPIEGSTSAFERTFLAENYWETSLMGLQNWIYFNHAESKKEVNYMGYMDKLDLGDKASLLKLVFKSKEIVQPTTVFVGTLPELEMALYTVCFFARPNEMCPVSLGGAKFNIFTHTFRSWRKDLLDVAIPVL